jgi:hypothetical protein
LSIDFLGNKKKNKSNDLAKEKKKNNIYIYIKKSNSIEVSTTALLRFPGTHGCDFQTITAQL